LQTLSISKLFQSDIKKLPKEIVEEIRFLIVIAKADTTIQYQ
ncbi:1994_t:CDS:1, partial [Scutellospora calospora]